jgi:hypothetical protein
VFNFFCLNHLLQDNIFPGALMHNNLYKRKLSLNERHWIVAARANPPFCNQVILEGTPESEIDIPRLEAAVDIASAANPGSRVVLKGLFGNCTLIDSGRTPRVRVVDGKGWSGFSNNGAPFFEEPLQPDLQKPACEVLVIKGKPLRLAFRTHHAVMDGRGTIIWVEDIFSALRGEPVPGWNSTINDMDLKLAYIKNKSSIYSSGCLSPAGPASGNEKGSVWLRKQIKGSCPGVIARIALVLAREAWARSDGPVRLSIPVDWRTLHEGIRTTANLSVAVTVDVTRGMTPAEFSDAMKLKINEQTKPYSVISKIVPYIPFWVMQKLLASFNKKVGESGRYPVTGVITGMRGISRDVFSGGVFKTSTMFLIPPYHGSIPFFIVFVDNGNTTELVATMPGFLANSGRIEYLLDKIISGLV